MFVVLSKVLYFFQTYSVINQSRFHASPSAMQDTVAQGLCRTGWDIDVFLLSLFFFNIMDIKERPISLRSTSFAGQAIQHQPS